MTPVIIPHHSLDPDTLSAMLEEFVTRDGTDYGEYDANLPLRVIKVRSQLESGKAVIVFDTDEETFSILPRDAIEGIHA
ncbi:MAG: hypothetical protein RL661_978 [Pseudomonadota bacterium]